MQLSLPVLVGLCVALGGLFEVRAVRQFRRRHPLGATFSVLSGLVLILLAACAGLLAVGLQGYERLTLERPVGVLAFARTGDRQYDATLTLPDGSVVTHPLRGDQWQIDARLIKWRPFANLVGFDSVYRLERLGGRYERIEDEQRLPRTVHALAATPPLDLWGFVQARHWPWIDAYYGTAAYLPMADGARFEVTVTQSGLVARPLNDAAREAIGTWR